MNINPVLLLSQLSGLLGAFIGGVSLAVAVYTHRSQDHLGCCSLRTRRSRFDPDQCRSQPMSSILSSNSSEAHA